MTWDDLGPGSRELAEALLADEWIPDLVLGISRGGPLIAGALAHALGVKNTATISVEVHTGIDERLEPPMLHPPVPDLVDLGTACVLIADDVADTVDTRAGAHLLCRKGGRGADCRPVRGVPIDRRLGVRVASNRSVDHLSVERPPTGFGNT